MRRALRMQSVPAHTTFLLEISLHNNLFLAAILSVPILKMQHTDSSHDLTHKWHVSCANSQKLNDQVTLAMASYKTSPKAFWQFRRALQQCSHQKNLRGFGGVGLDQWMRQWTKVFREEAKLVAKESQKLAEEWIFSKPGEWALLEAAQSSTWRCLLPSQPNSKLWAIRQTACLLHTHNPYKMEWSIKSITPPTAFLLPKCPLRKSTAVARS